MKLRIAICAAVAALACAVLAAASGLPFVPFLEHAFGSDEESVAEAMSSAQAKMEPKVSASALHEEGTLTVGIKQDVQLPMSTVDDSGSFQGLDIDLAADIAEHLGLKIRYMSVEDAADGFSQGCDIVMDMTDGEEDGITIAGTYAESALGVFGRNVDGTVTADDMSGRRVAVQMGSEAHSELSRVTPSVTFAYATNLNDCFHMLEAGEADYAVCSAYQGASFRAISRRSPAAGRSATSRRSASAWKLRTPSLPQPWVTPRRRPSRMGPMSSSATSGLTACPILTEPPPSPALRQSSPRLLLQTLPRNAPPLRPFADMNGTSVGSGRRMGMSPVQAERGARSGF